MQQNLDFPLDGTLLELKSGYLHSTTDGETVSLHIRVVVPSTELSAILRTNLVNSVLDLPRGSREVEEKPDGQKD